MSKSIFYIVIIFNVFFAHNSWAQYVIEGQVTDERNIGIPYADIYVKDYSELRTRADVEGKYVMRLEIGEYYLVFSAMGYEEREYYLVVLEKDARLDMQLFPEKIKELDGFDYSVKKRNIGREIVQQTVAIKHRIDYNQYPYTTEVYIRAKDLKSETEKASTKEEKIDARYDDIEELKRKQLDKVNKVNMLEVELTRSYNPPGSVKEVRTGYNKYGDARNLYFTTTAKSNFNFFLNTLYLNDLSKSPIQSPISTAGILSYKYQLVEKTERAGQPTLNKIKITARNISTSTLNGYIWIQDSTWMLEKLEFTISKGNLYIYDEFSIHQDFDIVGDSMCVLKNQTMTYNVGYRKEKFEGSTIVNYSNYDFNPKFDKKTFSNELAVTTEEAYDRDSIYWLDKRLTPLTLEEQQYIKERDSIENLFKKTSFLDSIDSVFNKVTFWKVVWFGIDHRNRAKKSQWTISSIAGTMRPLYIAGPRIGPDFDYFKKWDSERTISSFTRLDVGVLNGDLKGYSIFRYLYNPFKQAKVGFNLSHNYDLIRSYDALTSVFLRDNFIVRTMGSLYHEFEVFNGMYLESTLTYTHRKPVPENTRFIRWFDKALDNDIPPPDFISYNALIADFMLRYTPGQKYMREPKKKVILGSKWPTFYVSYEKGIGGFLKSEVNHDYITLGVSQTFNIFTLGTSQYHLKTGKFLNTEILRPEDVQYHRRGDPLLFSHPMYSYQALDSTLPTRDWYFESHYIHHFNGALLNKIPFMKKARITEVFGGGFLWVPEHEWVHYEVYGGLERIFKFAKRRLRIGAYGVFSDGNNMKPRGSFKISFAILDERNMKFTF